MLVAVAVTDDEYGQQERRLRRLRKENLPLQEKPEGTLTVQIFFPSISL